MKRCIVTTMDNIYNPFTQYDKWRSFDREHHYYTEEWIATCSKASPNLEADDYNEETSNAIDRLLWINPYGIFIKVYEDEADVLIPLANKAFEEMKKYLESS